MGGKQSAFTGFIENTADIDFWVAVSEENASELAKLIKEFGFETPQLSKQLFKDKGRIIRMGVEPTRIEILTEISGCDFADCYTRKIDGAIDGIPAMIINRKDLITNKLKSGRLKDLLDAQKLSS